MANIINTAYQQGPGFLTLPDAVRRVYSAEILFNALPVLKFDAFSVKKTELGTQPGQTIMMPKFGNIKRGGQLTEGVRMRTKAMAMSMEQITVWEQGNALGFSEFLLQVSFFDQMEAASIMLGRDMALVLDLQLRDTALAGTNVIYGDDATGTPSTTRAGTAGGFEVRIIKDAVETLETANAPKFGGDHYVGFIHPHQGRHIRDDSEWIQAANYTGATKIYTGEIGRFEDVRFVSTTVMPNGATSTTDPNTGEYVDAGYSATLDAGGASSADIFQAALFGENFYGFAVGLPVELRDNGISDFGREHALAWYAIWGTGVLEDANGVICETT